MLRIPESVYGRPKGSWIEPHDIVVLTGRQANHKMYARGAVAVAKEIERIRRKAGKPCTVRAVGDRLRICDDAEAATWNRNQSDIHERGTRRAHKRHAEVEVSNLTQKQRDLHTRDAVVLGARIAGQAAARSMARKMMQPKPTERTVPGAASYPEPRRPGARPPA
jgi:hypothetical protein